MYENNVRLSTKGYNNYRMLWQISCTAWTVCTAWLCY